MKFDIARAWKDAAYRESLSAEEQAMLPANPAGEIELSDAELETIHGAACSVVNHTPSNATVSTYSSGQTVNQGGLINIAKNECVTYGYSETQNANGLGLLAGVGLPISALNCAAVL
ncbi:MAG TPA: mersacidin/lichenicidin family type 2 lantibiotic [Dictyobacter sp.]|jgi:mersacidin/lichenicidin family type 2 lantibiotic|nr:mersacidin/lichenicidin family type 2 lantibiotic [Dictyobacter sp.]